VFARAPQRKNVKAESAEVEFEAALLASRELFSEVTDFSFASTSLSLTPIGAEGTAGRR
jgi:hypothetical protein